MNRNKLNNAAEQKHLRADANAIVKKYIDQIKVDEEYYEEEFEEETVYFEAPAEVIFELFPGKYKEDEVECTDISMCYCRTKEGVVDDELPYFEISPVRYTTYYESFDWQDLDIYDTNVIAMLLNKMEEQ